MMAFHTPLISVRFVVDATMLAVAPMGGLYR
jgi:hypothetical protein